MVRLLVALALLACTAVAWAADTPLTLIFDEPPSAGLPLHFRRSDGPFERKASASRQGLDTLHCSGSAQFGEAELRALVANLPGLVVDVDLRQESHGFINGRAVSWYATGDLANRGKSMRIVALDEATRLDRVHDDGTAAVATITSKGPGDSIAASTVEQLKVVTVAVEGDLVPAAGFGYERIAVTDHFAPDAADVNRFLDFVRALPKSTWLHFHCHAGDGRTTSFMAIYDMIRNARQVPFDDILRRQYLLGGIDLTQMPGADSWKRPAAVERLAFLRRFYAWCAANGPESRARFQP